MKKINLLMIDNFFISNSSVLAEDQIKSYLGLEGIKSRELETLNRFCRMLKKLPNYHQLFDNYYLNFKIPQIAKEFDLLRIGLESVLNIELKSEKVDDSEILKQLKRNYYYLSFLNKEIYCYTFVTDGDNNILYYYNKEKDVVEELQYVKDLVNVITNINDIKENNIDTLFEPTNYLISPFNTTEEFVAGKYFLTNHQEQIRDEIIKKIVNNHSNKVFSISGAAGTGKTLLTYDIAKSLKSIEKKVTIIHCAQSNSGIYKLQSLHGWEIVTIKDYEINSIVSDILIFDESHRLTSFQLNKILEREKKFLIFSHDVNQKLNDHAESVVSRIETTANKNSHKLKNKIRHNKNLASFIKVFFNLNLMAHHSLLKDEYNNISFYFTKDIFDAQAYVKHLENEGWEYIYLTPSRIETDALDKVKFSSTSSHKAIGQEYNNVVISITKDFYYKDDNKLSYNADYYYNPLETLFQAITRTRTKLTLVIIDNEEVYKKCVQIVNRD